jgi:hypothetical protein
MNSSFLYSHCRHYPKIFDLQFQQSQFHLTTPIVENHLEVMRLTIEGICLLSLLFMFPTQNKYDLQCIV